MDAFKGTIVIADTETTGAEIERAGVCQLAAVALNQDGEEWRMEPLFQTYCSPSEPMTPEALAVHGITPEMYKYAPRDSVAMMAFSYMLMGLPQPVVLSGYNCTRFDYPLMERLFTSGNYSQIPQIDVMTLFLRLQPEKGLKLVQVFEELVGDRHLLDSAHDALADCVMTAQLLIGYMKTYPTDPEVLAQWCATPLQIEVMPWGKHKGLPFKEVPFGYLQWMANKWTDMHPDLALSLRNAGVM